VATRVPPPRVSRVAIVPRTLYARRMHSVQREQPESCPRTPPRGEGDTVASAGVPASWQAWFDRRRRAIDASVSKHLNVLKAGQNPHSRLIESVEYSLQQGGKRLRPILVIEACAICGGEESAAMPAALAIECVHTFSLIHDDLPAMDDDDLRRGRPTNHKVFGEAVAILAGDWLACHAFELLAGGDVQPAVAAEMTRVLAGATADMIVGQGADIAGEQRPTDADLVRFIHRHKTARLIEAACVLGAVAAQAGTVRREALAGYGRHLGLAFQIADDLLDATGETDKLGKRAGKDAGEAKQTYPAACGIEQSRRQATREIEAACQALGTFGPVADNLRHLARFVIERDR